MATSPVQLLTFAFGPDATFEGQMLGAVERLESGGGPPRPPGVFFPRGARRRRGRGGTPRVLEVIFVRRDVADGTLSAFARRGGTAGGLAAAAIEFRLDEDQ